MARRDRVQATGHFPHPTAYGACVAYDVTQPVAEAATFVVGCAWGTATSTSRAQQATTHDWAKWDAYLARGAQHGCKPSEAAGVHGGVASGKTVFHVGGNVLSRTSWMCNPSPYEGVRHAFEFGNTRKTLVAVTYEGQQFWLLVPEVLGLFVVSQNSWTRRAVITHPFAEDLMTLPQAVLKGFADYGNYVAYGRASVDLHYSPGRQFGVRTRCVELHPHESRNSIQRDQVELCDVDLGALELLGLSYALREDRNAALRLAVGWLQQHKETLTTVQALGMLSWDCDQGAWDEIRTRW